MNLDAVVIAVLVAAALAVALGAALGWAAARIEPDASALDDPGGRLELGIGQLASDGDLDGVLQAPVPPGAVDVPGDPGVRQGIEFALNKYRRAR